MKAKTISSIINKKIKDWIDSIEDENVQKLVRNNTIVTGGCIASMLLNEDVNDFDVYFKNKETALAVAKYYVARFKVKNKKGIDCPIFIENQYEDRVKIVIKSAGVASENGTDKEYEYFETNPDDSDNASQYVTDIMTDSGEIEDAYEDLNEKAQEIEDGPKYRPIFMSTNAITLSHRIQIIIRFFGSPEEIHENYDFVHCTNYWASWDSKLYLNKPALEAILARELRYVGSKYPLCSILRMRKFIKRGWTINAGQILKAALQLNDMNLHEPSVLEDQLVGVDSAYFAEIIKKTKERDPEKIDRAYLIEVIDRLF